MRRGPSVYTVMVWLSASALALIIISRFFNYNLLYKPTDDKLSTVITLSGKYRCSAPNLNPFDPEILKHVTFSETIECPESKIKYHPIFVDDHGWLRYNDTVLENLEAFSHCHYRFIYRGADDFSISASNFQVLRVEDCAPIHHDVINIQCFNNRQEMILNDLITHPRNITRDNISETDQMHLSVHIIVLEATSRNRFLRSMPKSHSFMTDKMGFKIFNNHHRVGENSYPNLIPILSGKRSRPVGSEFQSEMPDYPNFTQEPLIWRNFQANNYVTSYIEDMPQLNLFQYLVNGFEQEQFDHNLRPLFMAMEKSEIRFPFCYGSRPIAYEQIYTLEKHLRKYTGKRIWSFTYFVELSHLDVDELNKLDDQLYHFLKRFYTENLFNHSAIFLIGDHGTRYGDVRNTIVGAVEENLPLMSIYVPRWFTQLYPELENNLEANKDRLTTGFDIHATQLALSAAEFNCNVTPQSQRNANLFCPIAGDRSCKDAGVPYQYCTCNMNVTKIHDFSSDFVQTAGRQIVDVLNSEMKSMYFDRCNEWAYKKVIRAEQIDRDGFQYFRVAVEADPSNANFEATLQLLTNPNGQQTFRNLTLFEISRINEYGSAAWCADRDYRIYCHCKRDNMPDEFIVG